MGCIDPQDVANVSRQIDYFNLGLKMMTVVFFRKNSCIPMSLILALHTEMNRYEPVRFCIVRGTE